MKVRESYLESLDFQTCPQDAGQIVDVAYAADERGVWRRICDGSDRTTVYEFGAYPARATVGQLTHEPWNGRIARHNKMRSVDIVG